MSDVEEVASSEDAVASPTGSGGPASGLRGAWRNPQLRYPFLVIVYLVVIGSAFEAVAPRLAESLVGLTRVTAWSVHALLGVFTELTTHRDHLVTLDGFAVSIIIECVGLLEMLIYAACVAAFPATIRQRALGVVVGCGAIFVFNLLRIVTLLVVGRHWGDYFDFFHVYFWQATLIAMIVSVLYGWIRIFVQRA